MFVDIHEMHTVIDEYKLLEMTDNNDKITADCILAAQGRVETYLRARYDTAKIFAARGAERDPELLLIVKNMALWFIVQRHNIDVLYSRVKEAYDLDIAYLTRIADGKISASWPLLQTADGAPASTIRMGSNPKRDLSY